jgi:hypothetical protein
MKLQNVAVACAGGFGCEVLDILMLLIKLYLMPLVLCRIICINVSSAVKSHGEMKQEFGVLLQRGVFL